MQLDERCVELHADLPLADDLVELVTAAFSVLEKLPPKLMLAAAGRTLFAVTQSIPAITPAVLPEPVQPSTRTATSFTFFATP